LCPSIMGLTVRSCPRRRLVCERRAAQNDMGTEDGKEGPDSSYDPPSHP
jgi:hypothetical protein